ncbi:hypothetical protein FB45DRAFT_1029249 [Roridomyces roridus]|uniref:Uncharacterized protein n=1 Tax=Roridomyces roridus TaxID=1738132 RepID=A0AAD7BP87_9AGAR|nr:hypothetical protein FB45DRAFT_1029249 [Roridomyces roridus]
MTAFADCPQDVLLELAKWLPVVHPVGFLSASSQTQLSRLPVTRWLPQGQPLCEIQHEKTLWLTDWTDCPGDAQGSQPKRLIYIWPGRITNQGAITFGEEQLYVYGHEDVAEDAEGFPKEDIHFLLYV